MTDPEKQPSNLPIIWVAVIAGFLITATACMPPQDDDKSAQNAAHSNYLGMDQQAVYQQPALTVCVGCHLPPGPAELPRRAWGSIIESMKTEMQKAGMTYSETDFKAITDYYEQRSPAELPELPPFSAD